MTARYLPINNHLQVFLTALLPYLSLASIPAILLFILSKRWISATIVTALLFAAVTVKLPLYVSANSARDSVEVRVLTANIFLGKADPDTIVMAALADADVLAVQELTPDAASHLSAGLQGAFPHQFIEAREGAGGVGLWSRYPIRSPRRIAGYSMAMISSRLRIDGVAIDPAVVVAHIPAPWPQPVDGWQQDMQRMDVTMTDLIAEVRGGAVIVMGDFNSTLDMSAFRRLLKNGYRDASEQAGTGSVATYPGCSWIPPIIAIDHVVTHGSTATAVSTLKLPGSDHRGLKATVAVPRSALAS